MTLKYYLIVYKSLRRRIVTLRLRERKATINAVATRIYASRIIRKNIKSMNALVSRRIDNEAIEKKINVAKSREF